MGRWNNIRVFSGICLLQLSCIFISRGQQGGGIFYHLTTQNGLSSNKVNDIIQDKEGYYWIATGDGLNRFDGSSCKVWRNEKNDTNSLSHNCCLKLLEDDQGNIWVTTLRGLNRYSRKEGRFKRYYFHQPGISFDRVNSLKGMAKDGKGNIWVSSYGLWKFDILSQKWTAYLYEPGNPASVPKGALAYLLYDRKSNGLWMSGGDSYVFFDLVSGKCYHAGNNPGKLSIFSIKSYLHSVVIDHKGYVWSYDEGIKKIFSYSMQDDKLEPANIKITKGVFRLSADGNDRVWIHFWQAPSWIYDPDKKIADTAFLNPVHTRSPLTNISVNQFTDKSGNYWISSYKGISIFVPAAQSVKFYMTNDDRKTYEGSEKQITSVQCMGGRKFWIGTTAGLYSYDIASRELKWITEVRVKSDMVRSLFLQNDSVLWVGGHSELIRYDAVHERLLQKIPLPSVCWSVKQDDQRNIWAVTWDDGLFKFTASGKPAGHLRYGEDSLHHPASNSLLCLAFTKTPPGLWMGYNGGAGFSELIYADSSYHHFRIPSRHPFFNISNTVSCISPDKDGNLWIGTYGGGLVFFNYNDKTFHQYTQSDGLRGNFINSILRDDMDRLWISTSNGLSILDIRSERVIQTDFDLSFSSNDVVPNGLKLENHNILFFAGNKIIEINPATYLRSSATSKIFLGSFKVFDHEMRLPEMNEQGKSIRLAFNDNFFSVGYSLLKPNPNSTTRYAYRLEGFDKVWNYVDDRRTAFYTNVPPGTYIFRVKATDAAGNWVFFSDPLSLIVSPPLWGRWWFITLFGLLALAGFYYLYRYRINQVKKFYNLRSKISHDLHDEVASTLSGIRLYGELAKTQLREKDIEKVLKSLEIISSNASEMKEDMSDIVWAVNPANDSFSKLLKKLKNYATEITHAAGISFALSTNDNIGDEKLNMQERRNIYLICKEAINNAVKYSEASRLELNILKEDHVMQINIRDNGIGFDVHASAEGNGLLNMKLRAKEIGSLLKIDSAKGKGTKVGIKVKL